MKIAETNAKFVSSMTTEQCPGKNRALFWMAPTFLFELTFLPVIVLTSISALIAAANAGANVAQFEWLLVLPLLTLFVGLISVSVQKDKLSSLLVVPIYDVCYGTLLSVVWMIAAIDEMRESNMSW